MSNVLVLNVQVSSKMLSSSKISDPYGSDIISYLNGSDITSYLNGTENQEMIICHSHQKSICVLYSLITNDCLHYKTYNR